MRELRNTKRSMFEQIVEEELQEEDMEELDVDGLSFPDQKRHGFPPAFLVLWGCSLLVLLLLLML